MRRAMQNEEAASDEECATLGSFASAAPQSPRCLEQQLFRNWQHQAHLNELRKGGDPVDLLRKNTSEMVIINANSERMKDQWPLESNKTESHAAIQSSLEEPATRITEAQQTSLKQWGHIDRVTENDNQKVWSPITDWAANLVGLQRRMQERGEELETKHRLQALQQAEHMAKWRKSEFDRLEKEVLESLNQSRNALSPWATSLMKKQKELEDKLKNSNLTQLHRKLESIRSKWDSRLHATGLNLKHQLEFDRLVEEFRASLNRSNNASSAWSASLVATQKTLEEQSKNLELKHASRRLEHAHNKTHANRDDATWLSSTHQAEFDRLEKMVLESLNRSRNIVSPWAEDLIATQKKLQEQSDNLDLKHARMRLEHARNKTHANFDDTMRLSSTHQAEFDRLEKSVLESLNRSRSTVSPWAKDLMATQKKLEDELKNLDSKRVHKRLELLRDATNSSIHAVMLNSSHAESKSLRDSRAASKSKFRQEAALHKAELEKRLEELAAARQVWETELLGPGMHRPHPSPQEPLEVKPLTKSSPTAAPALRGQMLTRLSWTAVRVRPQSQAGTGIAKVAGLDVLQSARWAGMIPKVSCITIIPSGQSAKARMHHFISNFRLQEYEGPRQLVLVYHYKDEEARELVTKYADGSYIKGVAAFGQGDLLSPVVFRYGAWVSDGDVVARWDFDHFHHPWRLSLQVRALALTSRAACFFRQPASSGSGEKQPVVASSLLGERTWMHNHWHPLLSTESAEIEGLRAVDMVEADVLALQKSARPSGNPQTTSMLPLQCFESEWYSNTHQDSQKLVREAISTSLGSAAGDAYNRLLTKHVEVKDKLLALCAEEAESVGGEDANRHQQLGRLAAADTEIEAHLKTLAALYQHVA